MKKRCVLGEKESAGDTQNQSPKQNECSIERINRTIGGSKGKKIEKKEKVEINREEEEEEETEEEPNAVDRIPPPRGPPEYVYIPHEPFRPNIYPPILYICTSKSVHRTDLMARSSLHLASISRPVPYILSL